MEMVLKIVLRVGIFGVITIIVLFAAFMGVSAWLAGSNNQPKGSNPETLAVNRGDGMKKALLVYQPSKSSAASDIAHQIAKGLNDSGYEVTMDYPGEHLPDNVSGYSVVVFGSPVYTGRVSSALTGYMEKLHDLSGKKVVIYSVGSLANDTKELDMLEKALGEVKPLIRQKFSAKDADAAYKLGEKAAGE